MILLTVQAGQRKIKNWPISLPGSVSDVGVLMATANLVLDTIRLTMKQVKKKDAEELKLHSDQGVQYASQAYFELTQIYGITPSMPR